MSLKKKTILSVKWSAISTLTIVILGFLQITLLSRIISPEDLGVLTVVVAITLLAETLSDFGISSSIIQKDRNTGTQLSTLYWVNVIFGIMVFFVVFFLSNFVSKWFEQESLTLLIKMISFSFVITPHGQQDRALLQKDLKFDVIGKIESVSYLLGFITTILLAFIFRDALCAVLGYLVNVTVRTLFFVMRGRRLLRPLLHFELNEVKGNLKFGAYLTADSVINYINSNMSIYLIMKFLGATATGGYNLAYNVTVNPPSKLNPFLTKIFFPAFSKIQNDHAKLKNIFIKLMSVVCFLNFPILIGLSLVSSDFVYVLFGSKWMFIVSVMQLLCIAGLLRAIGNPVGSLLMAKSRVDLSFKFNLVKFFLFFPALYLGAKYQGLIGMALGLIIVQFINVYFSYFFLIRPVLGKCFKDFISSIIIPFLHVFPMIVVLVLLNYILNFESKLIMLSIKITFGAAVYVATLFLSKNTILIEIRSQILNK